MNVKTFASRILLATFLVAGLPSLSGCVVYGRPARARVVYVR